MTSTTSPAAFSLAELEIDLAVETELIVDSIRQSVLKRLRRKGVVVGISGGIDSSVTAALCVKALGPQRVFGLFMPEHDCSDDALSLGRLLAAVDQAGLREKTLFIFTSDHGEMFGAQGRRAKNIFYEEAVRVPFVVRWPGHVPVGAVSDALLNTPDIMPTTLAMLDLPIPEAVEGVDLSHCAFGKTGPEPEAAFMQGMGCTAAWEDGHEWRALRSKQYTYATYLADGSELLFDHQANPYKRQNLVQDPGHADTLNQFRRMLKARMADLNDTFETCTWYRDHWTENREILRTATMG